MVFLDTNFTNGHEVFCDSWFGTLRVIAELSLAGIPFSREKGYEISYKGVILPHFYYADFVVWDKILLEAKAVESLTDSHVKQVLNYLAASKLRLGLLVNFGGDSLEWKRVVL